MTIGIKRVLGVCCGACMRSGVVAAQRMVRVMSCCSAAHGVGALVTSACACAHRSCCSACCGWRLCTHACARTLLQHIAWRCGCFGEGQGLRHCLHEHRAVAAQRMAWLRGWRLSMHACMRTEDVATHCMARVRGRRLFMHANGSVAAQSPLLLVLSTPLNM